MRAGDTIAERFEVLAKAGSGGMGAVYRARDTLTGDLVAVKVLHATEGAERFTREARLLAELSHPGIVRYVAHGHTGDGQPFLAMEWLDGCDLAQRLSQGRLQVNEALELVRRLASALSQAHERGIVHRDVKPANVFLLGGRIDRVRVLDFGVARWRNTLHTATQAGVMIGTVGYMSPEQARGLPGIGPASDVFALGCVLYECLSGKPPFAGEHVLAVLAKICLAEAPRLSELLPKIPPELESLLMRMLAKDPSARPADAGALSRELDELESSSASSKHAATLGRRERRVVSLVVIDRPRSRPDEVTAVGTRPMPLSTLAAAVQSFGGEPHPLADGSFVVTINVPGAATDCAIRAARCALAARDALPELGIAIATGRADLEAMGPVGEAIDRGAMLLREATARQEVRVDDITAGLLGDRFEVSGDQLGLVLIGARDPLERAFGARTLLGKQTPLVGRERELGAIRLTIDESASESVARVMLVTATAGLGKSRLAQAVMQAAATHEAEVWIGAADPVRSGAPFAVLADVVRRSAGVRRDEAASLQRRKILARVSRHLKTQEAERVGTFLAELAGIPVKEAEQSNELLAARHDARLMADQMRRAWDDWVDAESSARPLVLVLEDLQWGDLPSVRCLDGTLRAFGDRPLCIIAFARPEFMTSFPGLWSERGLQHIALAELGSRAAERLVRLALGEEVSADRARALVVRSQGNPFFLEELVRAEAEGRGDRAPDTVLAMVQARLASFDEQARGVLRAASVMGEVFWLEAVSALVGTDAQSLHETIEDLERREILSPRSQPRFAQHHEHAFWHALIREAAYAMLTEEDRALGHRLAGEWLEAAGETDAAVLADHYERGGAAAKAIRWHLRASEQACAGGDFEGALTHARRGVESGAKGDELGALRLSEAEARRWRGDFAEAERCGSEALSRLSRGSGRWWRAAAELIAASAKLGARPRVVDLASELTVSVTVMPPTNIEVDALIALARVVQDLLNAGESRHADTLLGVIDRALLRGPCPAASGWLDKVRASRALHGGDVGGYLRRTEASVTSFVAAGDMRNACLQRVNTGYAQMELGLYREAEQALRGALDEATARGLHHIAALSRHNLGLALTRLGRAEEARSMEREAATTFREQGDRVFEGAARTYLAMACTALGLLEEAEQEAKEASLVLISVPPARAYAVAVLADVLLRSGKTSEALRVSNEAMEILMSLRGIDDGDAFVRLTHATILEASGDADASHRVLHEARERLLGRANGIADDALRASFLEKVPENVRTLQLASVTP